MKSLLILASLGCFGGVFALPPTTRQGKTEQIYITDTGNNRVVRIDDMTGRGWSAFGARGKGVGQFNGPVGLSIDARHRLHIADSMNARVVRMDDIRGTNWTAFRTIPADSDNERFDGPALWGLTTGPKGSVYTANGLFGQVSLIPDLKGKRIRFYKPHGPKTLIFAAGVALDRSGRLYIADKGGRVVRMDNIDGKNWTAYGRTGKDKGEFGECSGICLDNLGRIYITDAINCMIVRIDNMQGTARKAFGNKGRGRGEFEAPTGICLDTAGRIYVTDSGNGRIVRIDDLNGTHWTSFGSNGSGTAQFNNPLAVSVR